VRWFQSTRPRGARLQGSLFLISITQFQSTRPRGARRVWDEVDKRLSIVSIHAPAWGATLERFHGVMEAAFQSTRPRGARPPPSKAAYAHNGFNPRARVGRDERPAGMWIGHSRFQSTRPRGARRKALGWMVDKLVVSIHAPAWGATP